MAIHDDVFLAYTVGIVLVNYSLWESSFILIHKKPWIFIQRIQVFRVPAPDFVGFMKIHGDG